MHDRGFDQQAMSLQFVLPFVVNTFFCIWVHMVTTAWCGSADLDDVHAGSNTHARLEKSRRSRRKNTTALTSVFG